MYGVQKVRFDDGFDDQRVASRGEYGLAFLLHGVRGERQNFPARRPPASFPATQDARRCAAVKFRHLNVEYD